MNKVFIGQELPLQLYRGQDQTGYDITVLASDGTAFDFTGITDLYLRIYFNSLKEDMLRKFPYNGTDNGISESGGVLTWSYLWESGMDLSGKNYYYDIFWEDANSKKQMITFGAVKILWQ